MTEDAQLRRAFVTSLIATCAGIVLLLLFLAAIR